MNKVRLRSFNTNRLGPEIGHTWIDVELVLTDEYKVKVYASDDVRRISSDNIVAVISIEEAIERITEEITDLTSFKEKCEFRLEATK